MVDGGVQVTKENAYNAKDFVLYTVEKSEGMITSGFIWGYLCDVAGRKKIMGNGSLSIPHECKIRLGSW
ncbi:hypothetical protein NQ318_007658 [Aromia moschata]|uniref:Uncharacterized protein n=1 Tax=Aromia moschata TaxID=1265417 RepID=A0AAV8XV19_9CUCU|nr:hypothetical protein NQ318_007658 [Aromia moschata]